MRQHRGIWILSLALLAGILAGALGSAPRADWRDRLLRLHVVAHSDSPADQAQKLAVRDAVLAAAEPLLATADSAAEATQRLTAALDTLTDAANGPLAGSGRRAEVTLTREVFPQRDYETFSLPAGEYQALRVTIGDGAGQNWWCVVYPSLCFAASAEEVTELAVSAGLSPEEAALLTGQQEGYVFRWRIVELLQQLLAWLRDALQ